MLKKRHPSVSILMVLVFEATSVTLSRRILLFLRKVFSTLMPIKCQYGINLHSIQSLVGSDTAPAKGSASFAHNVAKKTCFYIFV